MKALNYIEHYIHTTLNLVCAALCQKAIKTQMIFSTRLSTRADIYTGKIFSRSNIFGPQEHVVS